MIWGIGLMIIFNIELWLHLSLSFSSHQFLMHRPFQLTQRLFTIQRPWRSLTVKKPRMSSLPERPAPNFNCGLNHHVRHYRSAQATFLKTIFPRNLPKIYWPGLVTRKWPVLTEKQLFVHDLFPSLIKCLGRLKPFWHYRVSFNY